MTQDGKRRCGWAEADGLMARYHDEEWGVAVHDGRALWEALMLEGFQAGLSWRTILHKRAAFRAAFAGFVPERVAGFGPAEVDRLMGDAGIVRSRAKILATINGARLYEAMRAAGEDFADFTWRHAGRPAALSAALRQRGFKFVGPVIVEAWMQAVGMIDGHAPGCFRHQPG